MKTKAEVEATPIFKIVKKAIMRKYPWIKNIYVGDEEGLTKYESMLFLDMDIDALQMAEEYEMTPEFWITNPSWGFRNQPYYESVYLSTMVSKGDYQEARDLQNDIEDEMRRVQKSDAIPSEYKINKRFGIGQFKYYYPTQQEQPTEPDNTTITN